MTFIFHCGIFSIRSQAQDTRIADSLLLSGSFNIAALEYEKVYYWSDNILLRTQSRLKKVECLKQEQRFTEAVKDLNELSIFNLPDSLAGEIKYQIALCSYLCSDFATARSQLDQIHYYSKDSVVEDRISLLETLNYNQLFEFDKAERTAKKWVSVMTVSEKVKDSLYRVIHNLYTPKYRPRITKEKRAYWLSTFIPGSGQVYSGFTGEGSANLFLTAAVLGTGVYAFLEGYYLTGYIVGAGLFQKLYLGGIRRATFLSNKGNYLRTKKYLDELREQLTGIYQITN
ncbi:MAG: hypothetical protein AB9842_01990 [Bacteroidales bacterium]